MFSPYSSSRVSLSAAHIALASLLVATVTTLTAVQALAHHPGSHAVRETEGRVRLAFATAAADTCTTVQSVTIGAPASVRPVGGSTPVTVRLQRPPGALCATMVSALHEEVALEVPASANLLLVYIVAPDGRVTASERVPIGR